MRDAISRPAGAALGSIKQRSYYWRNKDDKAGVAGRGTPASMVQVSETGLRFCWRRMCCSKKSDLLASLLNEVCCMFECVNADGSSRALRPGGHVRSAHKAPKENDEEGPDENDGGGLDR